MTTNDKKRIEKALIVAHGMGRMTLDEVQDELDNLETGPALRVISLGWGLQSWVLAAMSALGELEPVDFAIHSDTTWERSATYEFAERWTPWLEERGVRVITVDDAAQAKRVYTKKTDIPACKRGDTEPVFIPAFSRDESGVVDPHGGVSLPAYTPSQNGGLGQLRRQCTQRWKITPMRRYIAAELKRRRLSKTEGVVEQWLGITLDEIQRAKDSDVKFITHRFPLLEKKMNRGDCITWLKQHGLPSPGKSACVFCPYQNRRRWEAIKRKGGSDWEIALQVDEAIRDKRPPYPLYVHPDRKPLAEAVTIPEDFGAVQGSIFDFVDPQDLAHAAKLADDDGIDDADAECDSGYCFM